MEHSYRSQSHSQEWHGHHLSPPPALAYHYVLLLNQLAKQGGNSTTNIIDAHTKTDAQAPPAGTLPASPELLLARMVQCHQSSSPARGDSYNGRGSYPLTMGHLNLPPVILARRRALACGAVGVSTSDVLAAWGCEHLERPSNQPGNNGSPTPMALLRRFAGL
jgi:hypothetical protein